MPPTDIAEIAGSPAFLSNGGEMGALMRRHDWASTPLGSPNTWEQSLQTSVSICLTTPFVGAVHWGPDLRILYNDAYAPALAERHPRVLGHPFRDVWPEIWDVLGPQIEQVRATGLGFSTENQLLRMERNGRLEDTYWIYSFAPIYDASGGIGGIFVTAIDNTAKVLAEQHRLAETKRQRRLFEQAPGFIAILSGPDHAFEFANQAYRHLVGNRDYIGNLVRTVLPELEGQGFFELLDGVYATGERFVADRVPIQLARPNGPTEERFLNFIYEPVIDEDGRTTGIFVEGHDVTSAYRAEGELRESEERNRRIVEGVKDHAIFTTDLNGRVIDWTPGAEAIFGWTADDIAGESSELLFTPEDRDAGVPARELAIAREQGCAADERWHLRRDGSRFFANGSVRPLHSVTNEIAGFIKIARDETERRQAEENLALSREQLRLATDIGEIGEWDVDHLTGAMYWPPRVKAMFGISADVPVTLDDFYNGVHPEDQETTRAAYESTSDPTLRTPYDVEYRTVGKEDGLIRWVAAKGRGLFDADGACYRVIGTAINITERKRAEERLRELNETLETRVAERTAELRQAEDALHQSQKLEAIGQLTGGVAHDFNNLLTVIRGSIELLRRTGVSEERRTRYINAIAETAERATKLTSQLLAFARRQSLKPEVFDPGKNVRSLTEMMAALTGSRVQIETRLPSTACWINADPSQFDTALINMAVNARDAMNGEGQLTIEIRDVSGIPTIRSHPCIKGDFVAVSLTDTGAGIPADKMERIFEPFFTTKAVGAGTGLGLSQVFGFAKQSGGEVDVHSAPGQGSKFTLYLPRVAMPAEVEVVDTDPLIDGHGACVLVVEDNVDVGAFATQALTELGYDTVLAADAKAALVELERDAERFDAVFSDVMMPGMNGVELGQEIRRRYPKLPVLLTSGYSHVLAEDAGHGFEILHKPYSIEELSRVLRKLRRSLGN